MNLNDVCRGIHSQNESWWPEDKSKRCKNTQLLLMHTEISEAVEGLRKNKMDDHLPHLTSEEVELADLFIRLADYCGGHKIDLQRAVSEKLCYNRSRPDHKLEARAADGGKKF